ncbi:MAG: hypothetical protein V4538_14710 [Bacteroidota bacterium]
MENKKHVSALHSERKEWLNTLQFFKDDIQSLQNRLEEIVKANTKKEMTALVESYQNQFIRQLEVNDELRHKINAAEVAFASEESKNPVATDHKLAPDHVELRDEVDTYCNLFKALRDGFNTFASKVL